VELVAEAGRKDLDNSEERFLGSEGGGAREK